MPSKIVIQTRLNHKIFEINYYSNWFEMVFFFT